MAVDLTDLVENLRREVEPPGGTLFTDATDAQFEGYLTDSFWELVIAGYISGFTEDEGVVTEDTATPSADNDISRQLQQLILINAGMKIIRIKMIDLDTLFRAHAGPVEFETQKSASVLKAVLDSFQKRYDDIIEDLPSGNSAGGVYYYDILYERGIDGGSSFVGY